MIDCHTHRLPLYPKGIISVSPDALLMQGQAFSVGLHPWYLKEDLTELFEILDQAATAEQVIAIGETGLDSRCDTPMWLQIKSFSHHIALSERLGKPLVVHCVRSAGEVAQMRKHKGATQPWIIHGFRGKPSVLKILLDAGCYISYGEHFNVESLKLTPSDKLLAETDESALPIEQIIARLSDVADQNLLPIVINNMNLLFE